MHAAASSPIVTEHMIASLGQMHKFPRIIEDTLAASVDTENVTPVAFAVRRATEYAKTEYVTKYGIGVLAANVLVGILVTMFAVMTESVPSYALLLGAVLLILVGAPLAILGYMRFRQRQLEIPHPALQELCGVMSNAYTWLRTDPMSAQEFFEQGDKDLIAAAEAMILQYLRDIEAAESTLMTLQGTRVEPAQKLLHVKEVRKTMKKVGDLSDELHIRSELLKKYGFVPGDEEFYLQRLRDVFGPPELVQAAAE